MYVNKDFIIIVYIVVILLLSIFNMIYTTQFIIPIITIAVTFIFMTYHVNTMTMAIINDTKDNEEIVVNEVVNEIANSTHSSKEENSIVIVELPSRTPSRTPSPRPPPQITKTPEKSLVAKKLSFSEI